jgi:hypothetical protein
MSAFEADRFNHSRTSPNRNCQQKRLPSGAKARVFPVAGGTAEAVPFPLALSELRSLDSRGRLSLREFFRIL